MATTQKLLLAAAGSSGASDQYWIYSYRTGSAGQVDALNIEADGNILAMDKLYNKFFTRLSPEGTLLDIYQFDMAGEDFTFDSSGNIIGVGAETGGAGFTDCVVIKYNSSGDIQAQRMLGDPIIDDAKAVAVDSSDNIYYTGFTEQGSSVSPDTYGLIAKYNSSVAFQFDKAFYVPSASTISVSAQDIAITSDDDVIIAGSVIAAVSGGGVREGFVLSYSSTGALNWSTTVYGADSYQFTAVAIDSTGTIYAVGVDDTNGDGVIVSFDSSGDPTGQWSRRISSTGNTRLDGIAIDSNDNVYVVGQTDSDGAGANESILFARYDSSGNLQWAKTLVGAIAFGDGYAIAVDDQDDVIVGGRVYATSTEIVGVVLKAPSSGAVSGTYDNFTISSFSGTSTVLSTSFSTGLWSSGGITLTEQAGPSLATTTEYTLITIA